MPQKRLRIFAGPNGSGKSSMLRQVKNAVDLGFYINADEIEKLITGQKKIDLAHYGISTESKELYKFFSKSTFASNKSNARKLKSLFEIFDNFLKVKSGRLLPPKYAAAIIAEFIREENLKAGNDFSFETVMSHPEKIEFIRSASRKKYNVYMYFICTDDVRVNIERVKTRVREGGHSVPEEKIKSRYIRTLDLLYPSLKVCYKSYLFDNSNKFTPVAWINRDKKIHLQMQADKLLNWFIEKVLHKIK